MEAAVELGPVGWVLVVLLVLGFVGSWAEELRRRDPPDERRD